MYGGGEAPWYSEYAVGSFMFYELVKMRENARRHTSGTREYDNMMYVEPLESVLVSGEVEVTNTLTLTLIAELDRCAD